MKILSFFVALALAWFGYRHLTGPIAHAPGALVAAEPQQLEVAEALPLIEHGDFRLKPLARFALTARVLHRRNYSFDRGAKLSPTDLALGWGSMSDSQVLEQLKISQSNRFYWYRFQLPPPIPQEEIARQSTNVHIIPADRAIARQCAPYEQAS
ncbi:MAG: hypothetical protein H0V56_09515 [Chthoniobacterales bacterium]|nr:hypothetical protein [Chthoniobacterales bacterium]